jgi:hypothetical protein
MIQTAPHVAASVRSSTRFHHGQQVFQAASLTPPVHVKVVFYRSRMDRFLSIRDFIMLIYKIDMWMEMLWIWTGGDQVHTTLTPSVTTWVLKLVSVVHD